MNSAASLRTQKQNKHCLRNFSIWALHKHVYKSYIVNQIYATTQNKNIVEPMRTFWNKTLAT